MVRMGKTTEWVKIKEQIKHCQKCALYEGATQAVPGEGNLEAKIMFIGEAPGFWEDQTGQPFVGEAGKLLDKLLASVDLKRTEVFISNVVKHRPPQNRDPHPSEIEECRPWIWSQIKIINPRLIVTLGRFALAEFFPDEKISKVHGQKRLYRFGGVEKIIIPMFHPAAVLWNRRTLVSLEEDFLGIAKVLEEIN